jgi:hypothetical protein
MGALRFTGISVELVDDDGPVLRVHWSRHGRVAALIEARNWRVLSRTHVT